MFTLEAWTSLQDRLLLLDGYVGMTPAPRGRGVVLGWLPGHILAANAAPVIRDLSDIVPVEHQFLRVPVAVLQDEVQRLISDQYLPFAIYVIGPDANETRINVTVARGSFAAAVAAQTDVLVELDAHVPVAIFEGDPPIAA